MLADGRHNSARWRGKRWEPPMDPWAGELGRRLRAAREATGWIPAQAAGLAHEPITVSGELIGKWERAERNIRVHSSTA